MKRTKRSKLTINEAFFPLKVIFSKDKYGQYDISSFIVCASTGLFSAYSECTYMMWKCALDKKMLSDSIKRTLHNDLMKEINKAYDRPKKIGRNSRTRL